MDKGGALFRGNDRRNLMMEVLMRQQETQETQETKDQIYKFQALKSRKGLAYVEMLPLLVLFVVLFGLSFGLWTSIHRATLKSIAARHYSFEVLNNRTHYIYHRDTQSAVDYKNYYEKNGKRFFANVDYQTADNPSLYYEEGELSLFNEGVTQINSAPDPGNSSFANPIKIKTGYGICIDTGKCKLN